MMYHVAQHFLGIFVVFAQLRATIIMRESHDSIYAFALGFGTQAFGNLINDTIHTTHGRDDPNFVTDTYVAILAHITFESQTLIGSSHFFQLRIVGIFQQTGQVGLDIFVAHPGTGYSIFDGMTNGITIFDNIFALGKVFQSKFMTGRDIFLQHYFLTFHVYHSTFFQFGNGNSHVVGGINFQMRNHSRIRKKRGTCVPVRARSSLDDRIISN